MKKGITLVSLVITIIILLILTGITLTTVVGDNGILGMGMKSKTSTENAHTSEVLEMAWSAHMTKIFDGTQKVPDIIDGRYMAEVITELNSYIDDGEITGISYVVGERSFSMLYEGSNNQLYKVNVLAETGSVNIERTNQANSSDYDVNKDNKDDKIKNGGVSADIYVFLYGNKLVFNNENSGLAGETLIASWNNVDSDFSFNTADDVLWKNYRSNIVTVEFLNDIYPLNLNYWFYNFSNLTEFKNMEHLHGEYAKSMLYSISGLNKLTNIDSAKFRTDSAETCKGLFSNNPILQTLEIDELNLINCTDSSYFLAECISLLSFELHFKNTYNIVTLESAFANCRSITTMNLEGISLNSINNLNYLLKNCSSLTAIYADNGMFLMNNPLAVYNTTVVEGTAIRGFWMRNSSDEEYIFKTFADAVLGL